MEQLDDFKQDEDEYFRLKGKFAANRITREEFDAALKGLMLQDAQGRYWVLGAETGKWHVHDGASWVEASPYAGANPPPSRPADLPERGRLRASAPSPTPTPAPAPIAKKSGGGCGGCILPGCLILVVLILVIGVGGFLAFRSGALTLGNVLNLAGLGPADIEVDNFRDDAIQVNVTRVEAVGAGTPTPYPSSFQLKAFDVRTHHVSEPGKYRIEFRAVRGNADLGNCSLTVRGGDHFQFVALPERIAINRVNNPSNLGSDFVIQKSSLCR
jgi:hypothetical protein